MAKPDFPFLTTGRAKEAFVDFVLPSVMQAMRAGHVNRAHLHVVVLDPLIPYVARDQAVNMPILFEYSIGKESEWEHWDGKSFKDFARAKALISWRTGLSSREVILTKPHLLRPGDTTLWGSAIVNGVIAAVSGVQPFYDEMFATMTAAAVIGRASLYADRRANNKDAKDFL